MIMGLAATTLTETIMFITAGIILACIISVTAIVMFYTMLKILYLLFIKPFIPKPPPQICIPKPHPSFIFGDDFPKTIEERDRRLAEIRAKNSETYQD